MNSLAIAGSVFLCAFGGAVVGICLQTVLPGSHLRQESKDVIILGSGVIATMSALVLGLLIATATSDFQAQANGFQAMTTDVILLDRVLTHYGPEADQARQRLRRAVGSMIDRLGRTKDSRSSATDAQALTTNGGAVFDSIRDLLPKNDGQRSLQTQALQIGVDLARNRWFFIEQRDASIPTPFLVVLAFWLFVLFVSFGIFAPRNGTVIAVLFLCALSVSGAILLIVDLDQPFDGLIQISSDPLRNAAAQISQ